MTQRSIAATEMDRLKEDGPTRARHPNQSSASKLTRWQTHQRRKAVSDLISFRVSRQIEIDAPSARRSRLSTFPTTGSTRLSLRTGQSRERTLLPQECLRPLPAVGPYRSDTSERDHAPQGSPLALSWHRLSSRLRVTGRRQKFRSPQQRYAARSIGRSSAGTSIRFSQGRLGPAWRICEVPEQKHAELPGDLSIVPSFHVSFAAANRSSGWLLERPSEHHSHATPRTRESVIHGAGISLSFAVQSHIAWTTIRPIP